MSKLLNNTARLVGRTGRALADKITGTPGIKVTEHLKNTVAEARVSYHIGTNTVVTPIEQDKADKAFRRKVRAAAKAQGVTLRSDY